MPRRLAPAVLASLALVAAGCGGDSAEEKAQSQVCEARANIQKSINALKGLTVSTATTDEIRRQVEAIRKDLGTIRNAQGDLNADRREQLQSANAQFTDTIRTTAQTVLRSTSAQEASTELRQAADQLETTYESTLAPIDCS
jgi:outer membrane lipopolysaccharide assembly protein LptE/RlpB